MTASFKNNLENGQHIEYFENGKVSMEVTYVEGKMSGTTRLFFVDGKPSKTIGYDPVSFKLAEEKDYATTGHVKLERRSVSGSATKSITYDSTTGMKLLEEQELFDDQSNVYLRHGRVVQYHVI